MALTYLEQARHRLNLTIRSGLLPGGFCLMESGPWAWRPRVGARSFTVAGQQIVVSSGAVGSPQLLMLSGIGPADHISSFGIEVVQDLPAWARTCATTPPPPSFIWQQERNRTCKPR